MSKLQTSKLFLVSLLILIAGAVVAFMFYNQVGQADISTDSSKSARIALAEEFKGAYDAEIEALGNVLEMDMVAAPSEVEIFNGVKTKVWSYNGQVPGPEIRVKLGDTLKLNFTNNLPQETTIHFHGVRVPNAMDGVPGVTQDPIQPGETFVYEFTPKDSGTYWYHPHVRSSEQVERGLFGTLVVEDDISTKYSQDKLMVIDDWRMDTDKQVDNQFNTPMDLMHDGRWGNVMTVNGKLDEVMQVRPGERLRLRLVNTSNARVYNPVLKGLDAKVIAVDGMYVKEVFDFGSLELSPGNRIDIDVTVPKGAAEQSFDLIDTFSGGEVTLARLVVSSDFVETPEFAYPINPNVPEWVNAAMVSVDKEYRLNARRKAGSGMGMMDGIEWTINDKAYPDYDPFSFKHGEFNKIRFTNESSRLHPMHLHGQFFKVVARNGKPVNEPHFRDTVLVRPRESVDIALVPLDKGKWVNHCHILEHAEAGMMTVVEVK